MKVQEMVHVLWYLLFFVTNSMRFKESHKQPCVSVYRKRLKLLFDFR